MHLDLTKERAIALAEIVDIAIRNCGINGKDNYRVTKNGILFADEINALLVQSEIEETKTETKPETPHAVIE